MIKKILPFKWLFTDIKTCQSKQDHYNFNKISLPTTIIIAQWLKIIHFFLFSVEFLWIQFFFSLFDDRLYADRKSKLKMWYVYDKRCSVSFFGDVYRKNPLYVFNLKKHLILQTRFRIYTWPDDRDNV